MKKKLTGQVAKNLKQLRKDKGFTMQSLADALKVDRVTVTRWESGTQSLSTDTLEKIAATLGVSVEVIFR